MITRSTSYAGEGRGGWRRGVTLASVLGLLWTAGCASAVRLSARYDGEPAGTRPAQAPSPTPPADAFFWSTIRTKAVVEQRPGGGRWVHVSPTVPMQSPGANRLSVLFSVSDAVASGNRRLRGGVTLRLLGTGGGLVVWKISQSGTIQGPGDVVGGVELRNPGLAPSSVAALNAVAIANQQFGIAIAKLAQHDDVVQVTWNIDQEARTFVVTADPGRQHVATMPLSAATSQGVANFPIQRLEVDIELRDAVEGTHLFVDDLLVEEY